MRRLRRTKIVVTLGPSSSDRATIARLFEAGADVFRINMSHTPHDRMRELIGMIRDVEKQYDRPIGILVDLQGPKLRLGAFAGGSAMLKKGDTFILDSNPAEGDTGRVYLPHPEILQAAGPNQALLLDDGKVRLTTIETSPQKLVTRVEVGGKLSDRKGVSLPETILPLTALVEKDRADLEAALNAGIDWLALSFIQRPEDIAEAKKITRGRASIMAKIEKPQAVMHLDGIMDAVDALMVARGDLGVELPPEDVPSIQKRIVRACRQAGTPVIVATQMLESMIASPAPTRAEASDVATAVYDGADAVMLSGETASGKYPAEAVAIMDRIIQRTEHDTLYRTILDAVHPEPEPTAADAISAAARQVGHTISAACIATFTMSGSTALRAARERPDVPILGLTARPSTARRLALLWGVHWVMTHDIASFTEMVQIATEAARAEGFAEPGQRLVVTAGVPFGTPGATNVLRIARVGE
jgi:pyruvate kinase